MTKRAKFEFTAEVFAQFFAMPQDAKVHGIEYDPARGIFTAYFFSDEVEEVYEGQESPVWSPRPKQTIKEYKIDELSYERLDK